MRHRILVIDDQVEERSRTYERLTANYVNEKVVRPPSMDIELVFAHNPHEVENLYRHNVFSAVILDIVLRKWYWSPDNPVRASQMLALFNDDIPVALLSSQWVSDEVKALVADWPTKNCRMFIHWDDIADETHINEGSITRILFTLTKYIEAYHNLDYGLSLEQDDPIHILHLSDLQFGGFDKWKLGLHAGQCATAIRRVWRDGPTFIAVTGDIAERGLPEEYEAAYKWMLQLVSEFSWSIPSSRIFFVPGNHDVCLPFAASSLLALKEEQKSKKGTKGHKEAENKYQVEFSEDPLEVCDLADYAFRPFLDFCSKLAPRPMLPLPAEADRRKENRFSYAWLEARFRHRGVVFLGLNTSQPVLPRVLPNRVVPISVIEDIRSEAAKTVDDPSRPPLFIGLTHHYPLPGPHGLAVDEPDNFAQLFADVPRMGLWLHGHWHKRQTTDLSLVAGGRLVVNSAPSLSVKEGKRPPDTSRGFSMIDLQRLNDAVVGCSIFPVEWDGTTLRVRDSEGRKFGVDKSGYFYDAG